MQQLETATAQGTDTVVLKLKSAVAPFIGNLEVWNIGIVSKQDVESRGEEKAFANAYGSRVFGLTLTPALQWTLEETTVLK